MMSSKKKLFSFLLLLSSLLVLTPFLPAYGFELPPLLPPCTTTGNCGICDILDVVVILSQWMLGMLAAVAWVLFVWFGIGYITSAGNPEKVEAARKGLMQTFVGIGIVLGAMVLVNIVINILVVPTSVNLETEEGKKEAKSWATLTNFLGREWTKVCSDPKDPCFGRSDGGLCGDNYVCKDKVCSNETACDFQYGSLDYKCQSLSACGLSGKDDSEKYENCTTEHNCIKGLCPGGIDNVCCKKE